MPFDGTYGTNFQILDCLTQVRNHLSDKDHWMKADLSDGTGRFCMVGAVMHYAQDEMLADLTLNVISKQIRKTWKYAAQSHSARVMRYNDTDGVRHNHMLNTLDKAIRTVGQSSSQDK